MSRRSWAIPVVLTLIMIAIGILGFRHIIEPSIAKPLMFAIACGYIYYRVSGGKKKSPDTVTGIMDKKDEK